MNSIALFNKVKNNDFYELKDILDDGRFPDYDFWSLLFNYNDYKLVKELVDYFDGNIGFNFTFDPFNLFTGNEIDDKQCYKILSLGNELNLLDESEFENDMEEEFYQVLTFGDGAFKVIKFFVDNDVSFHSDEVLFRASENGAEKIVNLLLDSLSFDDEVLGEALSYVYHSNENNNELNLSIFNNILKKYPSLEYINAEFDSHILECLFNHPYLFDSIINYNIEISCLNDFDDWELILSAIDEDKLVELLNNLKKLNGVFEADNLLEVAYKNNYKVITDFFN
ncbi:hypothetical protein MHO82_25590 [Vibrio sp. Of7-15]|uniref:hypothetical protein n=1 Tax=Vibrio sp. Of7-15 TaxID=2724879 RepID=UPI001EF2526A|nr:hypothetical protein [Vibrio sp. Of7-15]MCG7500225.1 hypothetical protein [Vibrio sp. Of7-15]